MNKNALAWDKVTDIFDTGKQTVKIHSRAADNILLAWPPILDLIRKKIHDKEGLTALDFGCGTGGLCHKLAKLKFTVTGVDISSEMIKRARKNTLKNITYVVGNSKLLNKLNPFNLITSIMVFQFIKNISKTLDQIDRALRRNGLLVFAVFNPEWVRECLKLNFRFSGFKSPNNPKTGFIEFNKIKIPTYIRSAKNYDNLMKKYHYKKLLEAYPPFTNEFLAKYPGSYPTNTSKFLILSYKKQ